MDLFHIYFLILVTQVSIFSTECLEKNSFRNNEREEFHSNRSENSESIERKHEKLNVRKGLDDSLNTSSLDLQNNTSKFQFNPNQSISVQPQNVTFTFLLSKLMRLKRDLTKRRFNNISAKRMKNIKQKTNFRDDLSNGDNEATNSAEASEKTSGANPGSENEPKNPGNNGDNSNTDESNKKEETDTSTAITTANTTEASSGFDRKVLIELALTKENLILLIVKIKKLLSQSGDYILSVLLRILKERLRKLDLEQKFSAKVKEIGKKYQGNLLMAQKELEEKLGSKFDEGFRLMLMKLLKILATNVNLAR